MSKTPTQAKQAVALRYKREEDQAPKVSAKGRGFLAEKMIEIARANQIPIREDKNLVQILSRLELEQEIQPEVYRAVAEILSFIYRMSQRRLSSESAG